MEIEKLRAISGICGAISRCGFAAASCFCAYHGIRCGAVFFALAAWLPGVTFEYKGNCSGKDRQCHT